MTIFQKTILFFIILNFVFLNFAAAENNSQIQLPETMEEVSGLGWRFLEKSKELLSGILKTAWREGVLPIWKKMYQVWSNFWENTLLPWLRNICQRIKLAVEKEINKRRSYVEKEIEKEKEEIKKEIPQTGQSLWERFKDLIK